MLPFLTGWATQCSSGLNPIQTQYGRPAEYVRGGGGGNVTNAVETANKTPGHGAAPCAKVIYVWSVLSGPKACFLRALAQLTGCRRRLAMPTRQRTSICRLPSFYNELNKERQELRKGLHFTVDNIPPIS